MTGRSHGGAKGHEGEAARLPLIGYQGTRVPAARFCAIERPSQGCPAWRLTGSPREAHVHDQRLQVQAAMAPIDSTCTSTAMSIGWSG